MTMNQSSVSDNRGVAGEGQTPTLAKDGGGGEGRVRGLVESRDEGTGGRTPGRIGSSVIHRADGTGSRIVRRSVKRFSMGRGLAPVSSTLETGGADTDRQRGLRLVMPAISRFLIFTDFQLQSFRADAPEEDRRKEESYGRPWELRGLVNWRC